jgi:hypothetical protein
MDVAWVERCVAVYQEYLKDPDNKQSLGLMALVAALTFINLGISQ